MINMSKRSFLLVLVSAFILSSCIFSDDDKDYDESYKIEFGFACGWCAGTGSITLLDGQIKYLREIPCGENKGSKSETEEFSAEEWNKLISSFDFDYFTTLEQNECNVCADGCDEIIKITKNNVIHEIRYNPSEDIEGIELLQEKLREYSATYFENN